MGRIIGIDLGTTNSVAAFLDNGRPRIIPNAEGERLTPSVVYFSALSPQPSIPGTVPILRRSEAMSVNRDSPLILVGRDAVRGGGANPGRTAASVKRSMGTGHRFHMNGKAYTPQEISGMILKKVKADAEAYLGEVIERAVITVPAYFNNEQREATREAGALAGLDVVRIINEPTAAALAYGLGKTEIQTILVWDLGGGTFDVSILELGDGVFEVKTVCGDTHLGGDDWDRKIVDYVADVVHLKEGLDLSRDDNALRRLKVIAEEAKIELSREASLEINIPPDLPAHPSEIEIYLTRNAFEILTEPLLQRMVGPTLQALSDAGLKPRDIDGVVLVGGSTRMQAVKRLAKRLFDGIWIYDNIDPDESVALGAAIQAGVLAGDMKDVVLMDVTPLSLGIEAEGGVFSKIIERNTPIPLTSSRIFTTAADDQYSVNIHVLQGEKGMASENMSLGVFDLTDIPPSPKGVPRIEVSFGIDADGILKVSAADIHTGNEQSIEITKAD